MLPEFRIFGPGISNPVPLEQLFARKRVEKVSKGQKTNTIKEEKSHDDSGLTYQAKSLKAYQLAESTNENQQVLQASQVMTTPVVTLFVQETASKALDILGKGDFRHIPVLSEQQSLIGMVSDRDIYRCMCGTSMGCMHCAEDKQSVLIEQVMKDEVLTASVDTDARYIARLFVEQRVGAMPIVEEDKLVGIVTRSDILKAVMLNLHLDVWK
ncbi:CBS domain-containing protein [Ghiorsea bivora]|uniref:CBS domain-containing protein n=1 Tax=Ghiorsea bivora TaxID=1485545 RepID=UPI00056E02A9|nr:CBS domain-containing protein [Ghiorsea bivora]